MRFPRCCQNATITGFDQLTNNLVSRLELPGFCGTIIELVEDSVNVAG